MWAEHVRWEEAVEVLKEAGAEATGMENDTMMRLEVWGTWW